MKGNRFLENGYDVEIPSYPHKLFVCYRWKWATHGIFVILSVYMFIFKYNVSVY